MKSWLDGQICPECGKKFFIEYKKSYMYTLKHNNKKQYYCSYKCTNLVKEKIENEKNASHSI